MAVAGCGGDMAGTRAHRAGGEHRTHQTPELSGALTPGTRVQGRLSRPYLRAGVSGATALRPAAGTEVGSAARPGRFDGSRRRATLVRPRQPDPAPPGQYRLTYECPSTRGSGAVAEIAGAYKSQHRPMPSRDVLVIVSKNVTDRSTSMTVCE